MSTIHPSSCRTLPSSSYTRAPATTGRHAATSGVDGSSGQCTTAWWAGDTDWGRVVGDDGFDRSKDDDMDADRGRRGSIGDRADWEYLSTADSPTGRTPGRDGTRSSPRWGTFAGDVCTVSAPARGGTLNIAAVWACVGAWTGLEGHCQGSPCPWVPTPGPSVG